MTDYLIRRRMKLQLVAEEDIQEKDHVYGEANQAVRDYFDGKNIRTLRGDIVWRKDIPNRETKKFNKDFWDGTLSFQRLMDELEGSTDDES